MHKPKKNKIEDNDETPGSILADMLNSRIAGKDTTEQEKKFKQATKDFFARNGVNCTFGD